MLRTFTALLVILTIQNDLSVSHQVPSFPGQQEPPLQGHHQQQAQAQQYQQQVDPGQQHHNQAQFGGEQVKDEGHIKEHLEGKVDPTAHMTPEQLQFHYFNMHDLDKNGKLDGVELIKAITHFHQAATQSATEFEGGHNVTTKFRIRMRSGTENENASPGHQGASVPPPLPNENELENMIDSILREDDFNGDGYIDYGEFLKAQKQREEQAKTQQQQQPPPQH